MIRALTGFVVGVVLTAAVFQLVDRSPPPDPSPPQPVEKAAAVVEEKERPDTSAPIAVPPPPSPHREAAAAAHADAEVARLRARVSELEVQLAAERQEPEVRRAPGEAGTDRVSPPEGLDPVFQQKALEANIPRILHEAGFDEAKLSSIDCTEYPCVVWLDDVGGKGTWERLKASPAFAATYGQASANTWSWSSRHKDGETTRRFAIALLPKETSREDRANISKNLEVRVAEMAKTFKGR